VVFVRSTAELSGWRGKRDEDVMECVRGRLV